MAGPGSSGTRVRTPPHGTGPNRHGKNHRARHGGGKSSGEPSGAARPPSSASGGRARRAGSGEGGTSGGSAHASGPRFARTHPARGARAGRCVGRGRARVACTLCSRRLLIGLEFQVPGPGLVRGGWISVAQVAPRAVFEHGERASLFKRRPAFQGCPARPPARDSLQSRPPGSEASFPTYRVQSWPLMKPASLCTRRGASYNLGERVGSL